MTKTNPQSFHFETLRFNYTKNIRHIIRDFSKMMCLTLKLIKRCLKDDLFSYKTYLKDVKTSQKVL